MLEFLLKIQFQMKKFIQKHSQRSIMVDSVPFQNTVT